MHHQDLLSADINQPATGSNKTGFLVLVFWLAGLLLVGAGSGRYLQQDVLAELDESARLMTEYLRGRLHPYAGVAGDISRMRLIREALMNPDGTPALQRFLQQTNDEMGIEALFILDVHGHLVGNSGHYDPLFYEQEFSILPYVQQALLGENGRYYASGYASHDRGYFFSAPVSAAGRVVGVVVVKVALEPLFQRLEGMVPDYLLLGYDGVIFAASRPDWLFNSLYPLAESQQQAIRSSHRYHSSSMRSLSRDGLDAAFHDDSISLRNPGLSSTFFTRRARMPALGWHLFALAPAHVLYQRIMLYLLYYSLAFAVLILLWLYQRKRTEVQRHVALLNHELEKRVDALTRELRGSNQELQELVDHYQSTQTQLQETRDQLVQTAKLAVLGEMSAGINHELSQPLLALNTYAENSLRLCGRQQYELVETNLKEILHITGSMRDIVSRFKVFARRTPPEPRSVNVQEVLDGTQVIMKPLLKKAGVPLQITLAESLPPLFCDPVQLQQVLVNLMTNAVEAMTDKHDAWIRMDISTENGRVLIRVCDSGPGIAAELRGKVFEPFFTTKARGLGLGLALSHRIIETLGGSLTLADSDTGGTCFVLLLPTTQTPDTGESE